MRFYEATGAQAELDSDYLSAQAAKSTAVTGSDILEKMGQEDLSAGPKPQVDSRRQHRWFYLYRYGTDGLDMTEGEVLTNLASSQGSSRISEGSMERKTRNYRFLETGQPASGSNASVKSKEVFARYKDISKDQLRSVVLRILRY